MSGPLEELYFEWLVAKVQYVIQPTPSLTYWKLLKELHCTEFVWVLSGDDNRLQDGLELRVEFLLDADIPDDPLWRSFGCSVLEMMIAFARRAEFQTEIRAYEWFWEFIENLNLIGHDDANIDTAIVQVILETFIWRTYDRAGNGSMFPLQRITTNQRNTEIWYQFFEYLVDQDRLP